MEIKYRTFDNKQSSFNQLFDSFEDAFEHYKKALDPEDECQSGLDVVVVDNDNNIICEATDTIISQRYYWNKGKLCVSTRTSLIKYF